MHVVHQVLRERAGKAATRHWRLTLCRPSLCADTLARFKAVRRLAELWQPTLVYFVDEFGQAEDGVDQGGLSAEMHSSFWREVLRPELGLFERAADSEGGALLPAASAAHEDLVAVGRVLCKSLVDDHPTGGGLARFAFDFLVEAHEHRVFGGDPLDALDVLAPWLPSFHPLSSAPARPLCLLRPRLVALGCSALQR